MTKHEFDCGDGRSPRILVAGMGAVGTALAVRLQLAGTSVSVLARGASRQVLARQGLRLTEPRGSSWAPAALAVAGQPHAVAFLCAKTHDLEGLAESVAPFIDADTLLVPVINGIPWWYFEKMDAPHGKTIAAVNASGRLPALLPSEQVVGCVALFTAERTSPGEVFCGNGIRMVVGEIDGTHSERVERLSTLLRAAGIETRTTQTIRNAVWTKVVMNLMSNPLSVIVEANLHDLCLHPDLRHVTQGLRDEAIAVAESVGAKIEMEPDSILAFSAGLGDAKTSMLQDYWAGRPLELAAICEAVLELGAQNGIDMPLTRTVASIARYRSNHGGR